MSVLPSGTAQTTTAAMRLCKSLAVVWRVSACPHRQAGGSARQLEIRERVHVCRQNFIQCWRAQRLNDVHRQEVALHRAPTVRPCGSSTSLRLCCGRIPCLLVLTPVACHDQPPDPVPACFIRLPRITSDITDIAGPPVHGCSDEMRIVSVSSVHHGCLNCWTVAICIDGKKMDFDPPWRGCCRPSCTTDEL